MMTDDKWTMCKLCGGKELVRMTQMDGSRFTVAECSGCLIRKQDKLNAEHTEAIAKLIAENTKLREMLFCGVCAAPDHQAHWHDWTRVAKKLLAEMETDDG